MSEGPGQRLETRAGRARSAARLSPVSLVLIGIASVQFGAAVAKGLFGEIPPVGMVWLRLLTSSLVLPRCPRSLIAARPIARAARRGRVAGTTSGVSAADTRGTR